MKVTVLGCGTSGGVPQVGIGWGDCDPDEPRNRRRRASILVEVDDVTILIDTSPDCREQLLDANVRHLDAVLFTHAHADHCHGIDDLRWLCHAMKSEIPVYGDVETLSDLKHRFEYCFTPLDPKAGRYFYKPVLTPHIINDPFEIKGIKIIPFIQDHGHSISLGFRIGNFAYSTDVVELSEDAFYVLHGIETWIVDALQLDEHSTHAHLDKTLNWINRVRPRHAIITHMNTRMDYQTLCKELPDHVEPAYDGLVLDI
ncbi:MBL fold metallo-hydrolase [Aestuariispira ectoiniformans]|uniref:MBL fold metallo-hydrolase n=1 Tax=Aestuariispira ectoiniformans TaxID=2775080 RepID=UPI00223AFAE9|nr:MBL fold metallo-hydrolase [Aestuariispira ectoiniformans]